MEHCFVRHIVQCPMYSYTITLNTKMSLCLHSFFAKNLLHPPDPDRITPQVSYMEKYTILPVQHDESA